MVGVVTIKVILMTYQSTIQNVTWTTELYFKSNTFQVCKRVQQITDFR